jgi:RNA polymerase sigma factor (sigma-70 family)
MAPKVQPVVSAAESETLSFEEFYRSRYHPSIRLAWLLTHSPEAAEDAVQEAFVALYRRFGELEQPGAYLDRSIVYQCWAWNRRQRRSRHGDDAGVEPWVEMPLSDSRLIAAVAGLPYRQRVAVVGRYWGDWSEMQIAAALSCRPGTVKSLTARALARLRKEVGDVVD